MGILGGWASYIVYGIFSGRIMQGSKDWLVLQDVTKGQLNATFIDKILHAPIWLYGFILKSFGGGSIYYTTGTGYVLTPFLVVIIFIILGFIMGKFIEKKFFKKRRR